MCVCGNEEVIQLQPLGGARHGGGSCRCRGRGTSTRSDRGGGAGGGDSRALHHMGAEAETETEGGAAWLRENHLTSHVVNIRGIRSLLRSMCHAGEINHKTRQDFFLGREIVLL